MSSPRILIASGKEGEREILADILRTDGCEVLVVASTDDAILQAGQFAPNTFIVDLILPGKMDGLLAAKRIEQETKCKVLFLEPHWISNDKYFDELRRDIPDCDILPTPVDEDDLLAIVHRRVTGWSVAEKRAALIVRERPMKLRYIEIDPDIPAELPNWSAADIERESENTLKELGIQRLENESYLIAWVRTMLAENGREDNPENRQRLIEAIREDWRAQLFVWVLGGEERKAFGVEDSPAFQEYLLNHHAARSLAPGAFYDHDDPRYWDYQPQLGYPPASHSRGNVVGPLFVMLTVLAALWLSAEPSSGRIILVIIMAGWVASYFLPSVRRENWPGRLFLAFLGGMRSIFLVILFGGVVVAWFAPWKWPWRLVVSLLCGWFFAGVIGMAWQAEKKFLYGGSRARK